MAVGNAARALLVDDHPLVMDALANVLISARIFASVVKLLSLEEALQFLAVDTDFALIIADLRMADTEGIESVTTLRESFPDLPVVVFSGDDRTETITEAFEAGIRGYITKDSPPEELLNAMKLIMSGGYYLPRHAINILGFESLSQPIGQAPDEGSDGVLDGLTGRQRDVFNLLLLGYPNKLIGLRLEMAEGTVKTHLNAVYRVLGVNNRAQAMLLAYQMGLLA